VMSSTSHKKYDLFLMKFGIDLRYSRAYSKKREDLFKNDPEFRYCEHAFILFQFGGILVLAADMLLTLGLYGNFPLLSMCLGVGLTFIVILLFAMTFSLNGKAEYIFSQTPIEIVEGDRQ